MRIGVAILLFWLVARSSGFVIAARVFSEFHAHQADCGPQQPYLFGWDGCRSDGVTAERRCFHPHALPTLGRLPVFPPPLDDQIEYGNKE